MRTDNGVKDLAWEVSEENFEVPERCCQDCASIFLTKNFFFLPTGVERSCMISFLGHLMLDTSDE